MAKIFNGMKYASEAIGTVGGVWIPGVAGKITGTTGWLFGLTGGAFADYIEKKDNGKGLVFVILQPHVGGWKPTKKFMITSITPI